MGRRFLTPFSIGNAHDASPQGDFRLLDVTDPANPRQLRTFPETSIGQNSANGCRIFQAGRSAAPTPDRSGAILSWYDGAQPLNTTLTAERTGLGGPNSAGRRRSISREPRSATMVTGSRSGSTPGRSRRRGGRGAHWVRVPSDRERLGGSAISQVWIDSLAR